MKRPEKRSDAVPTLFSLDSLVKSQEKYLKRMDVTVIRNSGINSDHNEVTFSPDTSFWNKEFGIFSSADIGKPSLYSRYKIEKSDSSGLMYTNYIAVDPAINGTTFMSVVRDSLNRIIRIKVIQQEKNLIFHRSRNMILNFKNDPTTEHNIISGYNVYGYQKMLLRKQTDYFVDVKLKWNPPV